jgi:hypothetical protein
MAFLVNSHHLHEAWSWHFTLADIDTPPAPENKTGDTIVHMFVYADSLVPKTF